MILGMAEPVLATAIKPVPVADMNGFRIHVDQLKGVTRVGTSDDFYYLGLYATLGLAGQCENWGPHARARLAQAIIPPAEQMVLRKDQPLPWPKAILEVGADDLPGKSRPMEYAWRVDGGLWSTWFDGPQLTVEHPVLMVPGHHRLEVRARIAGESQLVGLPSEPVPMIVDWEAPRVRLRPDAEAGLLQVEASDAVSAPEALRYAYRVGDGALSDFGAARPIDLAAVRSAGAVEVQVMDEAGLVGKAVWKAPLASAIAPTSKPASVGAAGGDILPQHVGCSAGGAGLALLALGFLPIALGRRRR
jgi:hypothetical protein